MRNQERDEQEAMPRMRLATHVAKGLRVRCPSCRQWGSAAAGVCFDCGMDLDPTEHGAEVWDEGS